MSSVLTEFYLTIHNLTHLLISTIFILILEDNFILFNTSCFKGTISNYTILFTKCFDRWARAKV